MEKVKNDYPTKILISKRSKKNMMVINKIFNIAAYIIFLLLCGTGFILKYKLPSGSGRPGNQWGYKTVLNLTRHNWGDIHYYLSLIFILLMIWHLLMHKKSLLCFINKNNMKFSTLIFLLITFLIVSFFIYISLYTSNIVTY